MRARHRICSGHGVKAPPSLRSASLVATLCLFALGTCSGDGPSEEEVTMNLTSSAFTDGGTIPVKHTCDGDDVSPALRWSDPPERTKSFALACTDPDAPAKTWVHWVLFNIPPETRELPEAVHAANLPKGASEGVSDFGRPGYGGPCPPRGPAHRYYFRVYSLDTTLALRAGARLPDLSRAMEGHVLAEAVLMGRYGRR